MAAMVVNMKTEEVLKNGFDGVFDVAVKTSKNTDENTEETSSRETIQFTVFGTCLCILHFPPL